MRCSYEVLAGCYWLKRFRIWSISKCDLNFKTSAGGPQSHIGVSLLREAEGIPRNTVAALGVTLPCAVSYK